MGSLKFRQKFQCKHLSFLVEFLSVNTLLFKQMWYLYIVKCADDSLYTGITTSLQRRLLEHNTNNRLGAKSLRGKRPVSLVYYEVFATGAEAAKRERLIKRWTRKYKLKLIEKFGLGKEVFCTKKSR